ncbi:MAG TPA: nickel-binding protein, partial [Nitrososphaeraceae archaeon]
EDGLIKEQNASRDELGVKTVNILYNFEVGTIYCLIDAPNKAAVKKHHDKIGVKCDWIMEVKTTQKT